VLLANNQSTSTPEKKIIKRTYLRQLITEGEKESVEKMN